MAEQFSILDLFAAVGGLSLGFKMAGYDINAAIEIDDWATDTYKRNFPSANLFRANITELSDHFFKQFHGIDAVVGGPPCQGFSISASNRRVINDPRIICIGTF